MDRTKANEYARRYREANRELLREKQRIYREKHRKELRKRQREYYHKNKERINKDPRQLKRHRDWIKKNPEKNRMYAHRRRLREKGKMIKFCKECGKEFEAGEHNHYQIFCCGRCGERNWRRNNREKIREMSKRYREKNREKCREKERRYREKNKEKVRERKGIYREKNREKIREKGRIYYRKNREKCREKDRRYYRKNREKIREMSKRYREKNREKCREKERRYREKNKEKVRERNGVKRHRRRARKKGNGGSFTAQQIRELRKQSQGICKGYKREPHFVGEEALTIDHIIPLCKGGTNNIDNIQLLCLSCNCKKGKW